MLFIQPFYLYRKLLGTTRAKKDYIIRICP